MEALVAVSRSARGGAGRLGFHPCVLLPPRSDPNQPYGPQPLANGGRAHLPASRRHETMRQLIQRVARAFEAQSPQCRQVVQSERRWPACPGSRCLLLPHLDSSRAPSCQERLWGRSFFMSTPSESGEGIGRTRRNVVVNVVVDVVVDVDPLPSSGGSSNRTCRVHCRDRSVEPRWPWGGLRRPRPGPRLRLRPRPRPRPRCRWRARGGACPHGISSHALNSEFWLSGGQAAEREPGFTTGTPETQSGQLSGA